MAKTKRRPSEAERGEGRRQDRERLQTANDIEHVPNVSAGSDVTAEPATTSATRAVDRREAMAVIARFVSGSDRSTDTSVTRSPSVRRLDRT
jgi:hypothetical protein